MIVRYRTFLTQRHTLKLNGLTMQDAREMWIEGVRISEWVNQRYRDLGSRSCDADTSIRQLVDELASQRIFGLGTREKTSSERSDSVEIIPHEFWVGAKLFPTAEMARKADVEFREIKVWPKEKVVTPHSGSSFIEADGIEYTRGPKSKVSLRREAISACLRSGVVKFNRDGPEHRYAAYMEWMKANKPDTDLRRGFGWKSFEPDEKWLKSQI